MGLTLTEWFGFDLADDSLRAAEARSREHCPFIDARCTKRFRDNTVSGACSVAQSNNEPVIICPNRLYAEDYRVLSDICEVAFGPGMKLLHPSRARDVTHSGQYVVPFGRRFGKELQLPSASNDGAGGYYVDWILTRIGPDAQLAEFVAVEVQTIDTTGSYKSLVEQLRVGEMPSGSAKAGFNWENVNKRILPQLIYKGHTLRREALCTKGLFFVCPGAVYERIQRRLGAKLLSYPNLHPGSISFHWYNLGPFDGGLRQLVSGGHFSTTVDQVALAFTSPMNLPPPGVYESAIRRALDEL